LRSAAICSILRLTEAKESYANITLVALVAWLGVWATSVAGPQAVESTQATDSSIQSPTLVKQVRPAYTKAAKKARIEGTVAVSAIVLQDGTVGEVHVSKSLDKKYGLDDEAVKAAKLWRFKPGMRFGQPVNVQVTIELTFKLK
jgi:protein TonB